jgi:uncharacterized protein (DUF1810 family)
MRIAPLADVKARLSAHLDGCGVAGPLVITRNGKAVAVLLVPYDDDDLERIMLGRHHAFKRCSIAPGKASRRGKVYPSRRSGKLFANARKNAKQLPRKPGEPSAESQRTGVTSTDSSPGTDDPHHLSRFVQAQQGNYGQALSEITSGRKRSHWMWYVFPQLDGLAFSSTSKHYAIKSLEEARAYLEHPVLGPRLLACAEAVVRIDGRSATEIFGSPDDLKLRSCATLFAWVSPPGSVFHQLLTKYYQGGTDAQTLRLVGFDAEVENIGGEA